MLNRGAITEEFKDIIAGLEQRIALYKSKLQELQKKRDKIEDEIKTVEKYLELAETLYRVEVEKSKAATFPALSEAEKGKREHSDIILFEKTKYAGFSIPQGAFAVLKEAQRAMHVKEIYQRLVEGGVRMRGKTPTTSVALSLSRNTKFQKVAPNTFKLVEAAERPADEEASKDRP